ncbi:Predicted metalloprotease, contains C-terminal PDZ domain [Pedobacter steynii]|uniref:Predicted metalloprotease, contains C-terminal PDZ domain n=1 Tax=Pedobacter steynii TaxID=430522 RepID=A0A1G9X0F3_9SPHI|nr:PDZ domain-containing protein [Pedobacter steynii]SDM90178.1 Predicted metalloprotease, contains C-terminal PDZ domain [Pedobacter steynii]
MKKSIAGLVILLSVGMTARSQVKVGFEVSFKEPQAHYVEMEMTISGLAKDYVDVKMPVWAPGSYLVREFAKSVEDFSATAGGKPVKFEKVKKNAWRVYSAKSNAIKIKYRVYGFEVSVRTPFIDESHAFLSSTGIFMYPDGLLKLPSTVKVIPFKGWNKVSTGLEPVAGQPFTYTASDFDVLFDSPIEVGNQEVFDFMASGVKHEVAMYGGGNYDKERLKVDMAKVIEQATAIYGENPNKHYTFIVHNFERGGGGLEHLNSTVLGASRNAYNTPEGYLGFLNLVAHEYFHLWNVKRMRPIALGPFDYDNENYTTNLWVAEGFTSYYENKLVLRAGFVDPKAFVDGLVTAVSNVSNTPGAKVQSAAESSYDAWIKGYRPNENSNNTGVSYYSKGEVVGLLMDLEIAQATKGTKSLDDVMKAMYLQGKTLKRGYTDAEFKAMVEKISGKSFTDFWAKYVNGTHPVEFDKYFGYAGISIKNQNEGSSIPYIGVASKKTEGRIIISAVSRNSAAWVDGLNVNDEVISVDGVGVEAALERMPVIASKKPGDVVTLKVKRDGIEKDIKITLKASPNMKLVAEIQSNAPESQVLVRKGWMGI